MLIETIKEQLESEGYQVVLRELGEERLYLDFIQKVDENESPMRQLLFFSIDGEKIKEVKSFPAYASN